MEERKEVGSMIGAQLLTKWPQSYLPTGESLSQVNIEKPSAPNGYKLGKFPAEAAVSREISQFS